MEIQIGLSSAQRQQIATDLSRLLADSYSLYIKTHNYHWNVTGPQFQSLHALFEQHYTELAGAVDEIAERIRALGHYAPGSYTAFSALTSIEEESGHPEAEQMVRNLVVGHETVARTAREAFAPADEAGDEPSCDLLTQRMQFHEKTAWMLRSMLE
ncbi:MAG: Dps family protein [Pseudomonadota bacterium]